jgi:hypothetical protein
VSPANGATTHEIQAGAVVVERAIRTPAGYYSISDLDKLAVDGSTLNRPYADFSYSSTWVDPACKFCFLPQFRRLFPRKFQRCPDHRADQPPQDPFPMAAAERDACEARVWEPLAERWAIPARYRDVRVEESRTTPAIAAVRDFVEDDDNVNRCLIAAGPTGVGKTLAAIAGFRYAAVWQYRPRDCAFFTMSRLARELLHDDERDKAIRTCRVDSARLG